MMKSLLRAIPAIGFAALATSTSAAVMTFDDLPDGLSPGPSYSENGLKMGSEQDRPLFASGGVMVGGPIETQGQYFNFTLSTGQAFTPVSVDLIRLTRTGRVFGNFNLAGYNETDDWISSVDFDNSSNHTVDISSLGKVYRLRLTFYNDIGGIDNLVFTPTIAAGVPEPASWALMLAGFGMIGFTLRTRSKPIIA